MALSLVTLALLPTALAYSSGKTGNSTTGCGSCHGSTASSATTVTFSTDDTTVEAGETITVRLTVAHATQVAAGLNVSATGGALAAGSNTKLSSSEITHSGAATMSSGSATFDFLWTAPSTGGTYTLRGAGNAVDGKTDRSNDFWNLASDLSITVESCADLDGDSVTDCDGDCDDDDGAAFPGASESCDDVDNDCDGTIDESGAEGESTWYLDADLDGHGSALETTEACDAPEGYAADGTDCDDDDDSVSPTASETPYDSVDQDCDGADLTDVDGDGIDAEEAGGTDCVDTDDSIYPGAEDPEGDGVDTDCSGGSDYDADGDRYDGSDWGGPDCDDGDDTIYPTATETAYDGIDQDCSGADLTDVDGDGEAALVAGGSDCDDNDVAVGAGATETAYDGIDQDCSGADLTDVDGDGEDALAVGGADCDDDSADTNSGAVDTPDDGVDQDCDGADATASGGEETGDPADGDTGETVTKGGCACSVSEAPRSGGLLVGVMALAAGLFRRRSRRA